MGSKVTMPTPPPAPAPVDAGQSSIDFVRAMSDPALQGQILASEQMYRPQYTALELADINTILRGGSGQAGLLDIQDEATRRQNQLMAEAASAQRSADISDVEALGGRAAAAFRAANPELQASLEQLASMTGSNINPEIARGQLGEQLYSDALGASGLGAVGQTLQDRAAQLAQSRGELTADELRQLEQSTREAFAARGRGMDNASVSAEALSRLTNTRQRMLEDLGIASSLNQAGQAEIAANRGFQQQVQGADISRQGANAQMLLNQLAQDRQFGLARSSLLQGVASDPFQAILGRPSQAPGAGMASAQFAAGLAQQPVGPQLFDPNAGINLALQQQSNLANYQSNIYGAQAGYAGATNQGRGAMIGGLLSGLGAVGGGFAACWVAREVYGKDNPNWLVFRDWLLSKAPRWFRALYLKYGERFAAFIADKPLLKSVIRRWMDGRISNHRKAYRNDVVKLFMAQRGTF